MKRPRATGGRAGQTSDDAAIWSHTVSTVEPLKRGKGRVHKPAPTGKKEERAPAAKVEQPIKPGPRPHADPIHPTPSAARVSKAPELAQFDRKHVRRLRAGRVEIEARVDLHGMRQDEAHQALRAFLKRCQSQGLRYVLVITGKGKAVANEAAFERSGHERGVLKRNVPRWLEEPDIRGLIVSFTTAALQHGGEGALYVHLRSKDRT